MVTAIVAAPVVPGEFEFSKDWMPALGVSGVFSLALAMVQTRTQNDNDDLFYLAFGIADHLVPFARSFADPPAKWFLEWPSLMTTLPNGDEVRLAVALFFKVEFHYMMDKYFSKFPEQGRIKFNLCGMGSGHSISLTVWELEQVSTRYRQKTDYYDCANEQTDTYIPLDSAQAVARIAGYLGLDNKGLA